MYVCVVTLNEKGNNSVGIQPEIKINSSLYLFMTDYFCFIKIFKNNDDYNTLILTKLAFGT